MEFIKIFFKTESLKDRINEKKDAIINLESELSTSNSRSAKDYNELIHSKISNLKDEISLFKELAPLV